MKRRPKKNFIYLILVLYMFFTTGLAGFALNCTCNPQLEKQEISHPCCHNEGKLQLTNGDSQECDHCSKIHKPFNSKDHLQSYSLNFLDNPENVSSSAITLNLFALEDRKPYKVTSEYNYKTDKHAQLRTVILLN